jgi:asparagine synthase (glutamine-hydrolysing)
MCGIAGVFKFSHRVTVDDVSTVLRMLDAQVHRGPDDWGLLVPSTVRREPEILSLLERLDPDHVRTYPAVASGPAVVLGARRLAIIDRASRGRMPMGTSDARQWVALNGEIYNFRELRTELGASPAFRSNTDTETLLRGWTAWGDGVVERLRGSSLSPFSKPRRTRDCFSDGTGLASSRSTRRTIALGSYLPPR